MKQLSIFLYLAPLVVLVVPSFFLSAPTPPNCELSVCEIRFVSSFFCEGERFYGTIKLFCPLIAGSSVSKNFLLKKDNSYQFFS